MDLSVFNLLMSTNPSASAAESLFSNAGQNSVPVASSAEQSSLKTGEAFLQALDQVRTGKTEKSADTFFNTLSARAEAASSLKELKKGMPSRENVKIVKLHIKRTRASEKLRKADELKATAPAAAVSDGQKIPTQENIVPTQITAQTQTEQNAVQKKTLSADFETLCMPEQTFSRQDPSFDSSEELTAADILINSALQTIAAAPRPQEQPAVVAEKAAPVQIQPADSQPQENTASTIQPQIIDRHPSLDALPDEAPEISASSDFIPTQAPAEIQENASFYQKEAFDSIKPEKAQEQILTSPLPQEHTPTVPADRTPQPQSIASAPVKTAPAAKENISADLPLADLPDTFNFDSFKEAASPSEAHRQAEELARELPTNTNIAITVSTQTPAAKAFILPQRENTRITGIKKAEENDTNTAAPAFADTETAAAPSEKTLTPHIDQAKFAPSSEKQAEQTDQPNGVAVLYAENKALPASQTAVQTESAVMEAASPNISGAPTAVLSASHELRGKAVSGNVPVQKNIPANELADQIKVSIKKALKDGLDKIDIIVKPKELGTIKIHLEIGKDGTMKAVLSTARAETLDLLQSDLTALKQALTDSGFDLNDQSFSFNYRGERYNDEHQQSRHQHHSAAAETDDDLYSDLPVSAGTLSISGRYALNIRV
ncbi:MAG: flagellar hook-length control protein FliK [Alphaproteobacteria bacterium]|nr:flagellar hook-length control protein FliK [Alphaproteobacteria bacterium]